MFRLRSIGVLSCAKVFAVVHGALGILVSVLLFVIGLAGAFAAPGKNGLGMVGITIMAIVMPFFYAGLGFVMGAVGAFVYNLVAQHLGGLELQLDAEPVQTYVAIPPAPPVAG